MIVQDKTEPKKVEFWTIPNGDVFMYNDVYYLAIDELEDSRRSEKNAVDLKDGEATHFGSNDMVVWVKATLVIEGR